MSILTGNNQIKSVSAGEFFGYLFSIRDIAHLTHLAQPDKSLATHKALNELYDEILDMIDGIVESYQGIYGIVSITIPATTSSKTPLQSVEGCYSYIEKNRSIFKESWIQNEIDNVCKLLAGVIYKLKFVK